MTVLACMYLGRLSEHLVQADELQAGQRLYKLREGLQFDGVTSDQREIYQAAPSRLICENDRRKVTSAVEI